MSGIIKLKVREGYSKDKRYPYYPEWCLEIIGENNNKIEVSPSYFQLLELFKKIMQHERIVDITRKRKKDSIKWLKFFEQLDEEVIKFKDYKLEDFEDIPNIYLYKKESENNGKKIN